MAALATDQRNRLENTVKGARTVAEAGAKQVLEALAVDRARAFESMSAEDSELRRRLRVHGRQLGDEYDRKERTQTIHRLVREVAYEHWHRMLFARFLAENELLIEPESGAAATMEECQDLARERGEDPWALAASFAERMLPQIFRADDPALSVTLPPETRQTLQKLLADLPRSVFTEDDSLGWTYQFWQAAEKDAVNARAKSGEKITGETLPAVTQLFTEPYMVQFLLHNTIGAWHAGRTLSGDQRTGAESEMELRQASRVTAGEGYDFEYLRFVREGQEDEAEDDLTGPWRPAAGTFERWPRAVADLTVLDPCCGSGHFLVAAFELLARLRMEEEGLDRVAAARAVLRDNLFGLELDARCTQIAAFNLALAVWKFVDRHIELPPMRIACSGIGPQASREEWVALAEEAAHAGGLPGKRDLFGPDDSLLTSSLRGALEALYDLFQQAPELGSLIDPRSVGGGEQADALEAQVTDIEPLLQAILDREGTTDQQAEQVVAAKGMAEAARILLGPEHGYTLVITNVPYLGRGSHADEFKRWVDRHHGDAKNNLATVFLSRMLRWVKEAEFSGTVAAVTPQSWLFQPTYQAFRERLLRTRTWDCVARVGPGGFETISGEVVNVALVSLSGERTQPGQRLAGLSSVSGPSPAAKAILLRGDWGPERDDASLRSTLIGETADTALDSDYDEAREATDGQVRLIRQATQLENPDARVVLAQTRSGRRLKEFADITEGLSSGDLPRVFRSFWEVPAIEKGWEPLFGSLDDTTEFGARSRVIHWCDGEGPMREIPGARFTGLKFLNRDGILLRQMGSLPVTRYCGEHFDDNAAVIVTDDPRHLPAIWTYLQSSEFRAAVRTLDQALKVTASSLIAARLDLQRWEAVAKDRYPNGLPEPYSDDPTQWLFHGHPAHAEPGTELHVGLARLLGYRWPAESDPEMRLSDEARALIEKSEGLDALGFTDDDGIVCLSPVRGEGSAAQRLRELMAAAYGTEWTSTSERELLASTAAADHGKGKPARSLDDWLRGRLFEEHCKLFHHRPFIWHVWDGLKDGFNALVDYHKLAGPDGQGRRTLESLTYTYLGEWIERQRAAQQGGQEGADARLAGAQQLQGELERILEGEPPYDIFVRWKPLQEQPLGWEPDLNDGVQLNIRPFMKAEDVGRKHAGILRFKPNCKWTPDRGKEQESLRPREEFPWFWSADPKEKAEHRIDFGATTPEAAPAGDEFDGKRWNALQYTRAAKQAAREAHGEGGGS